MTAKDVHSHLGLLHRNRIGAGELEIVRSSIIAGIAPVHVVSTESDVGLG